jgi:hypothetical protein
LPFGPRHWSQLSTAMPEPGNKQKNEKTMGEKNRIGHSEHRDP